MRKNLEFVFVSILVRTLGALPRGIARAAGALLGAFAYSILPRLRSVGHRNLEFAFLEKSASERAALVRKLYRNLGWLLAEFCQISSYTRDNSRSFLRYDGL